MNEGDKPTLERYQYSQFDRLRQFRLLQIIATGDPETPWCYDIVTSDLDDSPVYNALSYTWGSPFADNDGEDRNWENLPSRLVLMNGTYLTVRQNLYRALSQFAALDISGFFWIDALCINQNDIKERNEQVAMMGHIYANAETVVVWLGEEDWNSKVATIFLETFLPKLEALVEREDRDRRFHYSFSDPRLYERIGEPDVFPQYIFDGLATFLERTWFGRAWTFQEIVLARSVEVYCGPNKIDWAKLEDLLRFLDTSDWDMRLSRFANSSDIQQTPGKATLITMNHRQRVTRETLTGRQNGKYLGSVPSNHDSIDVIIGYLDSLLYSLRLRTATDKRDHLYALYGIVSTLCVCRRVRNPLPRPDYQRQVAQVFADFCKTILAQSSTLWLLSSVEDRAADDSPYPSWVPDFSKDWSLALPACGNGAYYNACRSLPPRLRATTSLSELVLDAYLFDEVNALGESDFDLGRGLIPFIRCAEMLLELPVVYHTGQDRAEVFWRTLIADQAQDRYPAPASVAGAFYEHMLMHNSMVVLKSEAADHKSKLDRLGPLDQLAASSTAAAETVPSLLRILERRDVYAKIQALQDSNDALTPDQEHYLRQTSREVLALESRSLPFSRQLGTMFASKRLIATIRGYVGAVPISTRPGDLVSLLPGARVPFILRARSDGRFRLVGEAYVHGIMQGEAFDSRPWAAREVVLV